MTARRALDVVEVSVVSEREGEREAVVVGDAQLDDDPSGVIR